MTVTMITRKQTQTMRGRKSPMSLVRDELGLTCPKRAAEWRSTKGSYLGELTQPNSAALDEEMSNVRFFA